MTSNFKDLQKRINASIAKTLQTDVASYTIKKTNSSIGKVVYGSYSPQVYTRKFGLFGEKNHNVEIHEKGNSIAMRYYHRSYIGGKDLSKLIILGQERAKSYGDGIALYNEDYISAYKKSGANDRIPFYKARNFIENAKQEMNKEDIIRMLKSGIR